MKQNDAIVPDFCVIGGGAGGLAFAAAASLMGASVVLVEKGEMGGDCLNHGCIPSKALIAAAKSFHENKRSEFFGWEAKSTKVDFKKVQAHIKSVITTIAPNDSVKRYESLGVKVIKAEASFIDRNTIKAGNEIIKAKRFIIATGSKAAIPDIEGIKDVDYLTNETIFDIKEFPSNLVIIGGGPIGIEMAQSFSRLGSRVVVLEAFSALPKDDVEIVKKLKNIIKQEGVDLQENVSIKKISKSGNAIGIEYELNNKNYFIVTDYLLVAAGRKPNLDSLNLKNADIEFTNKGIIVDKFLRTSNKKIYAIGDAIGGYQFTHVASYHAGLVIRNSIFKFCSSVKTQHIPWVTYSDPEIAHVGFTKPDLIKQNIKYQTISMDMTENDRAHAEHKTEGQIKILLSPRGSILGVTIMASGAGELITPWVLAIQNNLNISKIAQLIVPYPTLSEISKRVAGSYFKDKIFSPLMKKIVRVLLMLTR